MTSSNCSISIVVSILSKFDEVFTILIIKFEFGFFVENFTNISNEIGAIILGIDEFVSDQTFELFCDEYSTILCTGSSGYFLQFDFR